MFFSNTKFYVFLCLLTFCTIVKSDEGLNIVCTNMKSILGETHDTLEFTLEAVGFKYYDNNKKNLVTIKSNKLILKKDFFAVNIDKYQLGFQFIKFSGDEKPIMVMSKRDIKSGNFDEHYKCQVTKKYIN